MGTLPPFYTLFDTLDSAESTNGVERYSGEKVSVPYDLFIEIFLYSSAIVVQETERGHSSFFPGVVIDIACTLSPKAQECTARRERMPFQADKDAHIKIIIQKAVPAEAFILS